MEKALIKRGFYVEKLINDVLGEDGDAFSMYDEISDIILDELGLDPDYIFDLIY